MQPARQFYTILIFISALLWFGRLAVAGEEFWSLSQPHTQGVNEAILQRLHQEFQDGSSNTLPMKLNQLTFLLRRMVSKMIQTNGILEKREEL